MDTLTPVAVSPTDPRILPLIETHLTLMRASSPACSVHAMEAGELEVGTLFFAIFDGEAPVAMGALKPVEPGHGELKSMHVREGFRGKGLAKLMLVRLLHEAKAQGMHRVSLETGSQPVFAPARAFYAKHGFEECDPFAGYVEDPASCFMTCKI